MKSQHVNWQHPVKDLVHLATALRWPKENCRITRKYDGEFCVREIAGRTILGELVKPKSGGFFTAYDMLLLKQFGEFFAGFDCVAIDGQSIAHLPLSHRQVSLIRAVWNEPENVILAALVIENSGSIESVFAAGGEGVVRNEWSAPYGQILVCKVGEIYLCRVCSIGGSQSVGIEVLDVQPVGVAPKPCFVPLRGGKCDHVRVGSIIRVEGMGLTNDGKIRQPNPAREWLVKY
jgi:hypothetical protein